jgi:hypothetical protein
MTRERAKELLPIIQAFAEGRTIEVSATKGVLGWTTFKLESQPNWLDYMDYRIKPEPKLRPWKPEEVPVGALIRGMYNEIRGRLILGFHKINGNGPYICYTDNNGHITGDGIEMCFSNREYSLDNGKTWHPCGTFEE